MAPLPAPLVAAQASRPRAWSMGEVAGMAVAAVGGAAVVLTMMVPGVGVKDAGVARGVSHAAAPAAPAAVHPAAAASAVAAKATPRWRTTEEWTGGQRKSVAYEIEAERPVRVWMRQATPVLVVRCLGGALDAFVVTGSPTAIEPGRTDHTVRLVFDGSSAQVEHWGDSAEHDGLFAPDGGGFFTRLSTARRLQVGFTPHNAQAAEAVFDVSGVDALVAPLRKHCRQDGKQRRGDEKSNGREDGDQRPPSGRKRRRGVAAPISSPVSPWPVGPRRSTRSLISIGVHAAVDPPVRANRRRLCYSPACLPPGRGQL